MAARTSHRTSPEVLLSLACQDCLSLIIRYGADLNASDNRGWTVQLA